MSEGPTEKEERMERTDQSVGSEVSSYRTFICYRGKSVGHTAGLEIARVIYRVIRDEPDFASVFFAGGTGVRYEYIHDAEPIISTVKKFILVLTTHFFDRFFLDGETQEEAKPDPDPDSATRTELELAFRYNCDIYPVFSGEFSWDRVEKKTIRELKKYYGKENIEGLMRRANVLRWKQDGNDPAEILRNLSEIGEDGILHFLRDRAAEGEMSRAYEVEITNCVRKNNSVSLRTWLEDILRSKKESEDVRYAAFYTLQTLLRRRKDYSDMGRLFQTWNKEFSPHPSYSHLWILYHLASGRSCDEESVLRAAYEERLRERENAGYVHLFADVFATFCERKRGEDREAAAARWAGLAMEAVEAAIALDDGYAKYYCTKGRILALCHDYGAAIAEIDRAIDREDSRRGDYLLRISDYQYHKVMIQMGRQFYEWEKGRG